jgi:hypothetical protein
MAELRVHAVETLNLLRNKEMDITEAVATAKVYDSIISSCKTEMEYGKLTGRDEAIKFLEDPNADEDLKALENTRSVIEVKRLNNK